MKFVYRMLTKKYMSSLLKMRHAMNFYIKLKDIHKFLRKMWKRKFKNFCAQYKKESKTIPHGLM